MKRQYVTSSTIVSLGYNSDSHVLEIEFPTGTVYDYYDVPTREYINLLKAESKGKYFNTYIKPLYDYKQVG
jgi:hypothetical protein